MKESNHARAWLLGADHELQEQLDPNDIAKETLYVIASYNARGAHVDEAKSGHYERRGVPGQDDLFLFVWSKRLTPVPHSVYSEAVRLAEMPRLE